MLSILGTQKNVDLLVGAQWGDEGKGKVVDMLGSDVDVFVRFQGGANAGHTVITDGQKTVFHLLPSGMLYPGKLCVLGNGLVLDPEQFLAETTELFNRGQDRARLAVSPHAHVVMPYHRMLDKLQEEARGKGRKIGTTGRGIGPCYVDKYSRSGLRVEDLIDPDVLRERLTYILEEKNQIFTRLYGNRNTTRKENGTIEENGCGKMNDFTPAALKKIREMGVSHIWYTGIIRHATQTDYSAYGIPKNHPAIVKGKAGSPYAITDYYDIDPDLAVNVDKRMEEFEQLLERSHRSSSILVSWVSALIDGCSAVEKWEKAVSPRMVSKTPLREKRSDCPLMFTA